MDEAAEEALLRRVPKGDDAAFEALYARYAQRVRLAAWRFCRRGDQIDDLTNEMWCRAYRLRPGYDPARPFFSWLCGILHNVWREQVRKNPAVTPDSANREAITDDPSPDDVAADAEMLAGLNDCVSRLDPQEQDLVRWRFFEGQSLRFVAQKLGIAEATVREVRLPAVMTKLQRCLSSKGLADRFFSFSSAQGGPPIQVISGDEI